MCPPPPKVLQSLVCSHDLHPACFKTRKKWQRAQVLLIYNYRALSTAISQPSVGKKVRFTRGRQLRSRKRGMKKKVLQSHAVRKLLGLKQQAETGLPFGFLPQANVQRRRVLRMERSLGRMEALPPPRTLRTRQLLPVPAVSGHAAD